MVCEWLMRTRVDAVPQFAAFPQRRFLRPAPGYSPHPSRQPEYRRGQPSKNGFHAPARRVACSA